MTLIDEYTRECLALKVARRINSFGVIETLADAMLAKGIPEHVRCDNGPEMVAKALREWLAQLGTKTLYIEPGSPWENGYCESFNGKLRDECLKLEIFYSLKEAQIVMCLGSTLPRGWSTPTGPFGVKSCIGFTPGPAVRCPSTR